MKLLSQRNPNWAANKLGASSLTIGRYGCTTTCISMLSDYFGCFQTPPQIAAHQDWYTPDGLVLWPKFQFPCFHFVERVKGRDDKKIMESLKDPNKAVILEVNNGTHWVVATGKTFFGNDYKIVDPWLGDRASACGRYHNITGSSHFSK